MKTLIVAVAMLFVTQTVAPNISASFHIGHSVAYASDEDAGAPWWWQVVTYVVSNCVTNYNSGSWYDRYVCQQAVRFIRWLADNTDDLLCTQEWIDVASSPLDEDARIALHRCLLRNGLPTLR